jgi:hypothetical protein
MTTSKTRGYAGRWPRLAALAVLLAALAPAAGCDSIKDQIYFDDPVPELVLEGALVRQAVAGGTFYSGNVRNVGDADAVGSEVTVTPLDGGGAALGSFTTSVGVGVTEEEDEEGAGPGEEEPLEVVDDTIEPGALGSFNLTIPVPIGRIASERVTFNYSAPEEDEE